MGGASSRRPLPQHLPLDRKGRALQVGAILLSLSFIIFFYAIVIAGTKNKDQHFPLLYIQKNMIDHFEHMVDQILFVFYHVYTLLNEHFFGGTTGCSDRWSSHSHVSKVACGGAFSAALLGQDAMEICFESHAGSTQPRKKMVSSVWFGIVAGDTSVIHADMTYYMYIYIIYLITDIDSIWLYTTCLHIHQLSCEMVPESTNRIIFPGMAGPQRRWSAADVGSQWCRPMWPSSEETHRHRFTHRGRVWIRRKQQKLWCFFETYWNPWNFSQTIDRFDTRVL